MKMENEGLVVESAGRCDLPELEELYAEAYGRFGAENPMFCCTPTQIMSGEKYPKAGQPENFELLTVRLNEMLIGYAAVYRDFPQKKYVDLLTMYIAEPARNKGFGTLAAKLIIRYFYASGYDSVRTAASLGSWGSLRFWYRLGFSGILMLDAEGEAEDGGIGWVELEKRFDSRY